MRKPTLGGKQIWPPFTIPSGIITVSADIIKRVATEVGIGLITAKSVGLHEFEGYPEPIFSQYSEDSLSTAVGLSHPGVHAWAEEMRGVHPLDGKFLLASIFASNVDDFVTVAKAASECADGLELNFCCPHSLDYGAALARQEELTVQITRAVRQAVASTLVAKLTPDGPPIGAWARSLVNAGADAVAAIGPTKAVTVLDPHTNAPILSYGSGGLSGGAILQRGLECVAEIRRNVDVPIIAGGGIRGANDVRAYRDAGGDIFAVGTALGGLSTPQVANYFDLLMRDLDNGTDEASELALNRRILDFQPARVTEAYRHGNQIELTFDIDLPADPGQFCMAWLPGTGEKPFCVAGSTPLRLGIAKAGKVSTALYGLEVGDQVMIRGPFGKSFPTEGRVVIVAGGCGAAAILMLAQRAADPAIILGADTADNLLFRDDLSRCGELIAVTEDGSTGRRGTVLDALRDLLAEGDYSDAAFCNVGPEPMLVACADMQRAVAPPERIYFSIDRHTECAIGLCGKCALDGYRICVDGPVLSLAQFGPETAFGRWRRGASGRRVPV